MDDVNTNKQLRIYDKSEKYIRLSVDETIARGLNKWQAWQCSAGVRALYIDFDGNLWICNTASSKLDRFNDPGWKEVLIKNSPQIITEEWWPIKHAMGLEYRKTKEAFKKILDLYKSKNTNFTYIDEYTNPSGAATGGHFHLQYGAGTPAQGQGGQKLTQTEATPQMLTKMVEMLKEKGVKPEELKQYENQPVTSGGGSEFTDLNLDTNEGLKAYSEICQKFIDSKQPNPLNITGDMMAMGAKRAFDRYKNFVPAELALSQLALEGGVGNADVNSRPIKTKNPFNVGNVDSGANVYESNVQMSINKYYDLIAKDYIGKGKTAKDLLTNFVNKDNQRYASGQNYEETLTRLASQANRLAQPIVANIKPDTSSLA